MDCLKIKKMINKASSYLGMLQEARMRCLLLKQKIKKIDSEDLSGFNMELKKIKSDIYKYSRKLKMVYEEIKDNELQFEGK